jgi:proline iminopeptidase
MQHAACSMKRAVMQPHLGPAQRRVYVAAVPLPIPQPRESGYTTTTDVPLYWCRYGTSGAPKLLVVHGGPGASHDYMLPQMLALADRSELVFYDQRGGGRSRTDGRDNIGWETHVQDLASVVDELSLEPLSIVGYSWGALLALLYGMCAADDRAFPASRRLVLIDPAPISRAFREKFEAEFARRQVSEPVQTMRDQLNASGLRERDPDAYRQRAFELSVAGYFARPETAHELTPFRVVSRVQQSVWDSLGEFDLVPRLSAIEVPTLVVYGRQDPIPIESAAAIARALAARLVLIDACGHVPYVEQPESLFSAIRRFLSDTESVVSG